jgi:prepilin-type processing-associated H-X9-DG protein
MNACRIVTSVVTVALLFAGCQSSSQSRIDENASAMQALKHLALGCHMYAQDNDGLLPRAMADLKPYIDVPFDPDAYELAVSGKLEDVERPGETVLIRQRRLLGNGRRAVAFVDGHAAIVSAEMGAGLHAALREAKEQSVITEDWGSLTWLASQQIGNVEGLVLGRARIKAGKTNPRHRHPRSEEVLYLLRGSIAHTLGDRTIVMHAGDTITIAPGVFHNASCISDEDADMIIVYSEGVRGFELE